MKRRRINSPHLLAAIALMIFLILTALSLAEVSSLSTNTEPSTQQDENVEVVSQSGGGSYAVAVEGNYAYVGVGPRLVVYDLHNPANPATAGQTELLPGVVRGVAVTGDYAYVAAAEGGLRVINISDPVAPSEVGFYDTPGNALDVAVVASYAYVADHWAGLRIIDISDPTAPTEAGSCSVWSGCGRSVAVAGNYAYVAAHGAGLRLIDVSNPAMPGEASFYDTPGSAYGVAVVGNYAYVADGDKGLMVANVSDPAAPTEAGSYDTPGWAYRVTVEGSYAL